MLDHRSDRYSGHATPGEANRSRTRRRLVHLVSPFRLVFTDKRFEAVCLTPALVAFFYGVGPYGQHGQTWNSVLLFGGIALSRIGLWSFDLCQVSYTFLVGRSVPS